MLLICQFFHPEVGEWLEARTFQVRRRAWHALDNLQEAMAEDYIWFALYKAPPERFDLVSGNLRAVHMLQL